MENTDRNSSHLAGEYFVAAELYRRGYSVAMTLGNAKAIDLFAERQERTVNVQVKAIRDKKSVGWPMMKDRIMDNIIYVFVCLNAPDTAPEYFICTSNEARAKVKQYSTRGIINLGDLKSDDYRNRWDKVEASLSSVGVRIVPANQPSSFVGAGKHFGMKKPVSPDPIPRSEWKGSLP
jgi:hypothetical protein